jgi:hypothetical protein
VSGDKDFRSQLSDGSVNEFLDNEWTTKKQSMLFFYTKMSDFFKDNYPRGGPGCLNRFSASISGASARVRLPSGVAAG